MENEILKKKTVINGVQKNAHRTQNFTHLITPM